MYHGAHIDFSDVIVCELRRNPVQGLAGDLKMKHDGGSCMGIIWLFGGVDHVMDPIYICVGIIMW